MHNFTFDNGEGGQIYVREWLPKMPARASLVIAHGAAEHGGRYQRVAEILADEGFAVYAPDHRGHGRTATTVELAGDAGSDGFYGMIRDLRRLFEMVQSKHSAQKSFLLGHSMGAALSQRFIQLHGALLSGVVLSGSPGLRPNLEQAAAVTAKAASEFGQQVSVLFQQAFAAYNAGFEPIVSGFEWLSRDSAEVRKYVDDPWCGFPFSNRLVAQMSQCALDASQSENVGRIPKSLPILFLSGTDDRVGGNGEYVEKIAASYIKAGIVDVDLILYPEGRHEMLNELNRNDVHRDLLKWLLRHVTG